VTMSDDEEPPEVDGRTFRPFLLTGGRTRSVGRDIPIEALVVTRAVPDTGDLGPEQRRIVEVCRSPIAIAEIAVALHVPVGVARVLVSDLAVAGRVEVCATTPGAEYELLKRLIAGVRAI
jgi:hypothetical protein